LGYRPKIGQPPNLHGNLQGLFRQDFLTNYQMEIATLWKQQHSRLAAVLTVMDAQKIGILCDLGCTTIFNCPSAFMSCQKFALMGKSTDFTHG
jgi:hypothetical protein